MGKENYTVTFQRAIEKTLGREGGYVNDRDDPGGETNWGIAKRWHPDVDIKNLTRDGAIEIYHVEYWRPWRLDELRDPRLAAKILDTVVNQDRRIGPGALQGALILLGQTLKLDYAIGPLTIAAANSYPYPESLLEVFTVLRGMAYFLGAENIEEVRAMIRERKPRLQKNVRGWMKRLELGALALVLFVGFSACAQVAGILKRDSARVDALAQKYGKPADQKCAAQLAKSFADDDRLRAEDVDGLLSFSYKGLLLLERGQEAGRLLEQQCDEFIARLARQMLRQGFRLGPR